jgi:hypothetical protein
MHSAGIWQEDTPGRKGTPSIYEDSHVRCAASHHLLHSPPQHRLIKDGFMPTHDNQPRTLGPCYIADLCPGSAAHQHHRVYL